MDVARAVELIGGIARTRELRALGCTPHAIAGAVHNGNVIRIRIGWFGSTSLPSATLRAHRVGGVPACATVAETHGLWMLHPPVLHIEVGQADSRFRAQEDSARTVPARSRDDVVLHWSPLAARSGRHGQKPLVAMRHVAMCLPELEAVCILDSAANRGLVRLDGVATGVSAATRALLALCDPRAESGVETIFRLRARAVGLTFTTQVELPGCRVDFLFGDRLVVEVDGTEFHAGHEAFVADRDRDAWLKALGYYVVRLTYAQVVHRWHEVESLLRLIIARGDHLWPARIRKSSRLAVD